MGVGTTQRAHFCAGAYSRACGARDRGEHGADVCLYATAYLYQTCRVRAADLSCGDRRPDRLVERRRPRQSCTCGQCGHPCYATGRDVGGVHAAVCRRRVSPTMLQHAVRAAATQNILRSHSWAATWHDARCVYPLQVQEHYSGDYSDGGWMSRPLWSCGPLVVRRGRMHDAMACQQSGGFGRATTAT